MRVITFLAVLTLIQCSNNEQPGENLDTRIPVIFDTDANNELDDQHALAYLLFNSDVFETIAVTTNATYNGGDISEHTAEAERIMQLADASEDIPLIQGADSDFESIRSSLNETDFDGSEAVNFIIEEAKKERVQPLVLLPVGKLTNIALAIEKAPEIKDRVRIVWLGSNYPVEGEYNQDNDEAALNYLLEQDVIFEMVMVRYGESSGSDAVRVTPETISIKMPGIGPEVEPIIGRHGNEFTTFGDYSISLFQNIDLHGDPPSRALFDMVAVAILKNETWGERREIPAPILINSQWQDQPENERKITLWENFNAENILFDFFETMESPYLTSQ